MCDPSWRNTTCSISNGYSCWTLLSRNSGHIKKKMANSRLSFLPAKISLCYRVSKGVKKMHNRYLKKVVSNSRTKCLTWQKFSQTDSLNKTLICWKIAFCLKPAATMQSKRSPGTVFRWMKLTSFFLSQSSNVKRAWKLLRLTLNVLKRILLQNSRVHIAIVFSSCRPRWDSAKHSASQEDLHKSV